jgi:hypothetical protein
MSSNRRRERTASSITIVAEGSRHVTTLAPHSADASCCSGDPGHNNPGMEPHGRGEGLLKRRCAVLSRALLRRRIAEVVVHDPSRAGIALANVTVLVFSAISGNQFLAWGWRIPFLLSAIMIGWALRPDRHPRNLHLPKFGRAGADRTSARTLGHQAPTQAKDYASIRSEIA